VKGMFMYAPLTRTS